MPYGRFLAFNAPAGLVWAVVFVGLGFWAGEEWRAVARWVDRAGWVFIVGVVVGLGAKWLKGRRRRRVDLCPVPRGRRIESIMEQA
jgi:membrane-associated protein